jgi:hypothetical protein
MAIAIQGVLIGVVATLAIDVWALIVKHGLHLPTADWALVGRWFAHMPSGVFVHRPIVAAAPVANERAVGWLAHYLIGAIYGVGYLYLVQLYLARSPSLTSALLFGLVTLVAPWLIMQPAMGAGVFATGAPRPWAVRLVNLSMHVVFGVSLYGAWLVLFGKA